MGSNAAPTVRILLIPNHCGMLEYRLVTTNEIILVCVVGLILGNAVYPMIDQCNSSQTQTIVIFIRL